MKKKILIPIITILVVFSIGIVMLLLREKESPETAGAKECMKKLSELTDIAFDDMEDIQEIEMSLWMGWANEYTVTEPQDFEKILNTLNVLEFEEIDWSDNIEDMLFGGYNWTTVITLNSEEKIVINVRSEYVHLRVDMKEVYYKSTPEAMQSMSELYNELSESYEVISYND